MDALTDWLIAFVQQQNNPAGLAILAVSALIEYIFPPFPGDTITLFGAVLITAYDWSFAAVFLSVLAGSVGGSMAAFALGVRLRRRRERKGADHQGRADRINRLVERFQRHGPAYLVINRFLPGFRAFFFVAAGLAGMPARSVLAYGTLSAAAYNLIVIGLGSLLGAEFETLKLWMTRYVTVVWIALGVLAAAWTVRWWQRRRRARRAET